jgi:hypothetical protein
MPPIAWFDLVMHGTPWLLLLIWSVRRLVLVVKGTRTNGPRH